MKIAIVFGLCIFFACSVLSYGAEKVTSDVDALLKTAQQQFDQGNVAAAAEASGKAMHTGSKFAYNKTLLIAQRCDASKRYDDAIMMYRTIGLCALSDENKAHGWYAVVNTAIHAKKYDQVAKAFIDGDAAIVLDRKWVLDLTNTTGIWTKDDKAAVIPEIVERVKGSSGNPLARLMLAHCYDGIGNKAESHEVVKSLYGDFSKDPFICSKMIGFFATDELLQPKALEITRSLVEIAPNNVLPALAHLGVCMRNGAKDEGLAEAQRIVEKWPNEVLALDGVVMFYRDQKMINEAIDTVLLASKACSTVSRKDYEAWILAHIYVDAGRVEEAVAIYHRLAAGEDKANRKRATDDLKKLNRE